MALEAVGSNPIKDPKKQITPRPLGEGLFVFGVLGTDGLQGETPWKIPGRLAASLDFVRNIAALAAGGRVDFALQNLGAWPKGHYMHPPPHCWSVGCAATLQVASRCSQKVAYRKLPTGAPALAGCGLRGGNPLKILGRLGASRLRQRHRRARGRRAGLILRCKIWVHGPRAIYAPTTTAWPVGGCRHLWERRL